jgi:four helix bundle protein
MEQETAQSDQGYKKLLAWRKAHEVALDVYRLTLGFPPEERFGLTAQLRRAALSVPANLAEGHVRSSKAEFRRFIEIARGSNAEAQYLMEFAHDMGYMGEQSFRKLIWDARVVGRLLFRLLEAEKRKRK